jgi:chemotaxis signal transduction protein
MREAFDASFAEPRSGDVEALEELLAIRAGDAELALRAREIAQIVRCPPLTPVPCRNPALSGLAGVRSSLVAVYSIAALMGWEHHDESPRWIVLCAADRSVALLFDQLVGYERVPTSDIHAVAASEVEVAATAEVVRLAGVERPVIDVARLLRGLRRERAIVPTRSENR